MTSPRATTPPKRHDVLGVWKKPAPTTVTALAAPEGRATDGNTACTPPSAGTGRITIVARRSAMRANAPSAFRAPRAVPPVAVARAPIARRLFFARVYGWSSRVGLVRRPALKNGRRR